MRVPVPVAVAVPQAAVQRVGVPGVRQVWQVRRLAAAQRPRAELSQRQQARRAAPLRSILAQPIALPFDGARPTRSPLR
jgi:hypothetical protein